MLDNRKVVLLSVLTGVSVAAYCLNCWINRNRRWIRVGRVKELWLFPLKSAKGQSVMQLDCFPVGPKSGWLFDRRLLLVNQAGAQVTAKDEPQLVLVDTEFHSYTEVTISHPNMPTVMIDLSDFSNDGRTVLSKTRLGIEVETRDCGDEVAEWFCRFFHKPSGTYRLRYHSEGLAPRKLNRDPKEGDRFGPNDFGTFVKLSPYMLMSEASVKDMSEKSSDHGSLYWDIQRFRPTMVIEGPAAYDEDGWSEIQIGTAASFRNVRHCTRCSVTEIDPTTGEINDAKEPMRTLRKYRLGDDSQREVYKNVPMLGIHLILSNEGRVKVGDEVKVVYA